MQQKNVIWQSWKNILKFFYGQSRKFWFLFMRMRFDDKKNILIFRCNLYGVT